MLVALNAGDTVRAASWSDTSYATVGTIERFAVETKTPVDELVERSQRLGHALAWTTYMGGMLVADRKLAAQLIAAKRYEADRAVTLAEGDKVVIVGRRYTVHFPQKQDARKFPSLCDPIHFVREG